MVAFASDASDLARGRHQPGHRRLHPGPGRLAGHDPGQRGECRRPGRRAELRPSLANDVTGTSVAFASLAANLVEADTNNTSDIFLRHLPGGTEPPGTVRVSLSDGQGQSSGYSYEPRSPRTGSGSPSCPRVTTCWHRRSGTRMRPPTLIYGTSAGRPAPPPPGSARAGWDRAGRRHPRGGDRPRRRVRRVLRRAARPLHRPGRIRLRGAGAGDRPGGDGHPRVSAPPGGGDGTAPATSVFPAMSADGRFVAFSSSAADLVAGDSNRASDIFVARPADGATTRVSVGPQGAEADGPSLSFPFLSADGRFVTFSSDATNLVTGDNNGVAGRLRPRPSDGHDEPGQRRRRGCGGQRAQRAALHQRRRPLRGLRVRRHQSGGPVRHQRHP